MLQIFSNILTCCILLIYCGCILDGSRVPFRAGNQKASDIIVGTATGNARRMGEPMVDPVDVNVSFFMMTIISVKLINMMLVRSLGIISFLLGLFVVCFVFASHMPSSESARI